MMFNFLKKRISVDELAKRSIYACTSIIYDHEDQSVRGSWLLCRSIPELKSLIKEPPVLAYIDNHFNSPKFLEKYKKLSDQDLERVKKAIYYSFMEMPEFIERSVTIRMGQIEVQERTPGMRVSWRFPEFNEYPEQFLKIKSVFK